jgi:ribonuclease HII
MWGENMRKPNFYYEGKIWKNGYKFVAGIDEVGRGAFAGPVVAGCVAFKYDVPYSTFNIRIDDSKKLTVKQRNIAEIWIKENCLTWGIGESPASEIDKIGIVKATRKAMRKAIGNANRRLHKRIQYLLINAFYLPYIKGIRMPLKYQRQNKSLYSPLNSSKRNYPEYLIRKVIPAKAGIYIDGENYLNGHSKIKQPNSYGQQTAIIKGDQKSISIASASIIAKVYRDGLMTDLGKNKKYKKYGWENNKGYGTKLQRNAIKNYGVVSLHRKTFIKGFKKTVDL